jgi:PKD repeat protein
MKNRFWPLLAMLCLLAILGLGCGGGRSAVQSPQSQAPTTGNPLAAALPAPSSLVGSTPQRAAAGATLLRHFGSEIDPALTPQNASASGATLALSPNWSAATPQPAGLALALYRFTVAGYTGPTELHVDWTGSAAASDRFVAVADFTRNRWAFLPIAADGSVALTAEQFAAATAPATVEFLAVAVSTGSLPSQLAEIRIGENQGPLHISGVTPTGVAVYRTTTLSPVYTGENPASWTWDFGGAVNTTYRGRNPSVYFSTKGAFNCKLTAVDNHGVTTEFPFQLQVLDQSLVAPEVTAVLPNAAETGTQQLFYPFQDGGEPTAWSWNFGGGATPNTSTDDWPTVTLGAPGAYQASVTASNSHGSTTVNFTLYVVPAGGDLPPALYDYSLDTYELDAGQPVTISAANDGGDATSWSWDFGTAAQPSTSTEASPQIVLPNGGVFHCSVTATNAVGSSTLNFTLNVQQPAVPELTNLNANDPQTGIPLTVYANNAGGAGYAWSWDFGGASNPNTSTSDAPRITPLAAGTYHGTVIARNNVGSSTLHFDLVVTDPPAPHLTGISSTDLTTTIPQFMYANNDGGQVSSWTWNFGGADPNLMTSTEDYPTLTPPVAGMFHGSVTATNVSGSSTFEFDLNVADMAPPDLDQVFPGQVLQAQQATFFANTNCNFQMTWQWDFGGACEPNTSTDQFPQAQVTAAPGTYNCTVSATNAGGTTTFPFTLTVLSNN